MTSAIHRLRNGLQRHRQLLANFASLSSVNLLNLLVPLITIPYLLHTLGVYQYGVVALHQYLGQFVLMLVDFGFPVYCVNEVSRRVGNKGALAQFVGSVYLIKTLLALLVALVVGAFAVCPDTLRTTGLSVPLLAAFATVGMVNSFYPGWLFQGLERIHAMILPTGLARLCMLVLILLLVRNPQDAWRVPLVYVFSGLLLNVSALGAVWQAIGLPGLLPLKGIRTVMHEASQVFWSRLIIMVYVACSPMLVRAAGGAEGVAIYSLCEKAVTLARMPFDMFANAIYPRFAREYRKSFARRLLWLQVAAAVAVVALLGALLMLAGPRWLPPEWIFASRYLVLYAVALIPVAAHGFLGNCVLLVHGKRVQLSISIVAGLLAYLLFYGLGGWWFVDQIVRVIAAMVMVEFGICLCRYFYSRRFELI